MKRKWLALAMAVVLLLSLVMLAGCETAEQLTAYKLVTDAMAKTEALDSADMTLKMDMSVNTEGMTLDVPMTYDIKGVGLQSESPKLSMTIAMSVLGVSVSADAYVENGYYYMSVMGENVKYKAEDAEAYNAFGQADSMMVDLPEEILKDVAVIANEDGSKTVKVALDAEQFNALYDEVIASASNSAASGAELDEVTISDPAVEITVADSGYIAEYKITFDMTLTMDALGETVTATAGVDMTLTYNDPGQPVTVTAPEGYLNYPETDLAA